MPGSRRLFAVLLSLLALAVSPLARAQTPPPRIAAAASTKSALDEIVAAYARETGGSVVVVYGSSGNFRRQIEQGAPFELFLSADESFVDQLADAGFTRDRGVIYGVGRLALFAPHGSPLAVDARLDGLRSALAAGAIRRFAIANPQLAPYGRAAEEALRAAGLWDAVRPLLVQGENISQAAQFASGGSAEGGIVSLSLAQTPELARLGRYALIRAELHAPLAQRMALLRSAGAQAEAFYTYLRLPAAQAIFRRHGFLMPGEEGG